MVIYIKDMVCIRCIMAVEAVLTKLHIEWKNISMGQVVLFDKPGPIVLENIDRELNGYHLALLQNRKDIIAERIKTLIIDLLHNSQADQRLKLSCYLSDCMHYDYTYLSNIFSEHENSTIEKYFISQRLERVKELIIYEQLSVTEIADLLHFSSVSHLCIQFRKITGQTPAAFRKNCHQPGIQWRAVNYEDTINQEGENKNKRFAGRR